MKIEENSSYFAADKAWNTLTDSNEKYSEGEAGIITENFNHYGFFWQ